MINQNNIEKLFDVLDESATILYKEQKMPYLDGVIKTCENIMANNIEDKFLEQADELQKLIASVSEIVFQKEEIRKAFQYACLKGFKHANVTNQMITPDSIGIFFSYLIDKLTKSEKLSILDPLVGTGNLIATIANHRDEDIELVGVDNNLISYKLASALFDMLGYGDKIFCQNTETFVGPKVEIIATDFSGVPQTDIFGIIKQQTNNIAPDGFLIGVIDNEFFDQKELTEFISFVKDDWHFFGLVVLPKELFKNQEKSILILQNKGPKFIKPKAFMMADIPSFDNKEDMLKVIEKLNLWFKNTDFYRVGE